MSARHLLWLHPTDGMRVFKIRIQMLLIKWGIAETDDTFSYLVFRLVGISLNNSCILKISIEFEYSVLNRIILWYHWKTIRQCKGGIQRSQRNWLAVNLHKEVPGLFLGFGTVLGNLRKHHDMKYFWTPSTGIFVIFKTLMFCKSKQPKGKKERKPSVPCLRQSFTGLHDGPTVSWRFSSLEQDSVVLVHQLRPSQTSWES